MHTVYSDGIYTPEQVINIALSKGLSAVAVADHDTTEGVKPFLKAAAGSGLVSVPAVEMSTRFQDEDVHILIYGVDPDSKELNEKLDFLRAKRLERARRIIECLKQCGFELSMEDVARAAGGSLHSAGRAHIARVLVNRGYAASVQEAFDRFLARGKECFMEKDMLQLNDILSIPGIHVLAHPGHITSMEAVRSIIASGVEGLEVFHPDHDDATKERFLALAEEHSLLVTGGSDAHGPDAGRGYDIGDEVLPDQYLLLFLDRLT